MIKYDILTTRIPGASSSRGGGGKDWRGEELNEEELQQAMQRIMGQAATHMEDSVSCAYLALLVGCLLQQDEVRARTFRTFSVLIDRPMQEALQTVCNEMPSGNIGAMLDQLKQFMEFMEMTVRFCILTRFSRLSILPSRRTLATRAVRKQSSASSSFSPASTRPPIERFSRFLTFLNFPAQNRF